MPNGANMILGQVNTASSPTRLNQTGSSPGDALVVTSHGFGGNAIAGHCASESRADAAVLGSGTAYAAGVRGRLLYAIESPEARFEDFGRASLTRGRVQVALDPSLAGVVRTGDYHVFLTAEGDCRGLYVARRTSRGFEVREQGGGRSRTRFSYRVVATRKDVRARRFARVALPRAPMPRAKDLPPALRRRARSRELALGDVGQLMANAWGSKTAPAPVPRPGAKAAGARTGRRSKT